MTRTLARSVLTVLAVALVAAGCGRPRRSSGLTLPSGANSNGSLSGTVVAYGTTTPIAGATIRLGGVATVSNSTGQFTLGGVPDSGAAVASVVLPGYLYRGVALTLAPNRVGVNLDIIRDAAPFSLDFYRQIARNGAESATLFPTARWTVNPNFYFQRLTVDTATAVPDDVIQSIEDNFTQSVPELSGGRLSVGTFTVGDGSMAAQDGWVIVTFYTVITSGSLGNATVGGNSGTMIVRYDPALVSNGSNNPYNCSTVTLQVADNLIMYTMGFWHTTNILGDEFSGPGCPGVGRPANTVYHTSVVYSRPPGNVDPDVDPVSAAQSRAPFRGARPVVVYDPARIVRGR